MDRRSFLAAICALPFVGKIIPQKLELNDANYQRVLTEYHQYISTPDLWEPMTITTSNGVEQIFISSGGQGYVLDRDDQWPAEVIRASRSAGCRPSHSRRPSSPL